MRFADSAAARFTLLAAAGTLAIACADGFDPLSKVPAPLSMDVTAVRLNAVRVTWPFVEGPEVIGYMIERRSDLAGPFSLLVAQIPKSGLSHEMYLDTDVQPDTYYGYRVFTVTQYGDRSRPSVVGGTRTPSLPGIAVQTMSNLPTADAVDPDGYELTITGPDTVHGPIGVSATRRFTPLRPGQYTVKLSGVIPRCATEGPAEHIVNVSDSTAITVVPVAFQIVCRDPSRAEITVTVNSTGTNHDPGHSIELLGEASDASLPDSVRLVAVTNSIGSSSGSTRFLNLRPGTYEVTLEGLATNCQLDGALTRTVTLAALENRDVRFDISCTSGSGGGSQEPGYQYRAVWTTLPSGEHALELRIDARTHNRPDIDDITTGTVTGDPITGAQLTVGYDGSRLAYNRFEAPPAPFINAEPTVNGSVPGFVSLLAGTTVLKTGDMGIIRIIFSRVPNSPVGSVTTSTTLQSVTSRSGGVTRVVTPDVRINEGTLTLTSEGGGGVVNQTPVAKANGPYSGAVNTPLVLSSAGTTDPDGTIASYSWSLGNGQTAAGASPSVAYAVAGAYTVVLTVTDNSGAADTDQATVTVTGGAAANVPPVARVNGPYSATTGVSITLSSAGSTDPDGQIASYAWTLGDGRTANGASPSVSYPTVGTFPIVLTVTDNHGATATQQTTVTVSNPAPTRPLVWRSVVGPIDVANNQVAITVSYDMRGHVAETPDIEVLASFKVDSLKWDPSVLQFSAINLGPNIVGTSNQAKASAGNLGFQGSVSGAQAQGLITIATIRFKLVGTPGSRTTTVTTLGTLQGAPSTGDFVYNSKTAIVEGEFITP